MLKVGEWYNVQFKANDLEQGYGTVVTEMEVVETFSFTCHVRFLNVNGVNDLETVITKMEAERFIENYKKNH